MLGALAAFGFLAWGAVAATGVGPAGLVSVIWVLAIVAPFILLREFVRRSAFAHLLTGRALVLDLAVAVISLGGLASLTLLGSLRAASAVSVAGLACATAGVMGLWATRHEYVVRRSVVMPTLRQNWKLGRWVLASQLVSDLGSDVLALWLLASISGKATTGVFAACVAIVGFSNPLLIGITHVLTPKFAQAVALGGRKRVRRLVIKATLVVGTAMGLFCAVLLFGSELALRVFYGEAYAGHGATVFVLALAGFAWALGMVPANGLLTMERADVNFRANVCGLVATATAASCLIGHWGVFGVAVGILAGRAAAAALRWFVFWRLTSEAEDRVQS